MQIHVEVVTRGKRGRERIATIERDANVAGTDGIGLTLDEVKRLAERLQSIVAAEQVQEVVSAHSACAVCGRELPRKGSLSGILCVRHTMSKIRSMYAYSTQEEDSRRGDRGGVATDPVGLA